MTLRLRLEFKDLRKAMIRGIFPPHQTTVSVARRIDYDIAHFTTDGIVDDEKYSLTTLTRHLSELESYTEIVGRVTAAMMTVSSNSFHNITF